ncbi:MAG: hypothetical protein RI995_1307 [Bacteroidota bacterium]|jgi:LysM repeat protein
MKNPLNILKDSGTYKLPAITLLVLIATIVALLFVGYENFLGPSTKELEKAEKIVDQEEEDSATGDNLISTSTVENTTEEASEDQAKKDSIALEEQKKEAEAEKVPETEVSVDGKDYAYTVQKGETFMGIANRFGLKYDQLKALNPDLKPEGIKVGVTKVNVKVKAIHIVGKGDILRVVAEKYKVSKQSIMTVNHKTEDLTTRGEELIIPLK